MRAQYRIALRQRLLAVQGQQGVELGLRIEGGSSGTSTVSMMARRKAGAVAPPVRLQAGVAVRAQREFEAVAVQRAGALRLRSSRVRPLGRCCSAMMPRAGACRR
jgi:hypothetical protein